MKAGNTPERATRRPAAPRRANADTRRASPSGAGAQWSGTDLDPRRASRFPARRDSACSPAARQSPSERLFVSPNGQRWTLGETGALSVATAIALVASGAEARITRIEIVKSEPAFGGASFGEAGAYVHLVGRVSGELDPADPANA